MSMAVKLPFDSVFIALNDSIEGSRPMLCHVQTSGRNVTNQVNILTYILSFL